MALKKIDLNGLLKKYRLKGDGEKKNLIQEIGLPRLIVIILAGIVLLITSLPSGIVKKPDETSKDAEYSSGEYSDDYKSGNLGEDGYEENKALNAMNVYVAKEEKKLERMLEKVDGIGKVDVMITLSSSEEKMTLRDSDVQEDNTDETDSQGGTRKKDTYSSKSQNVLMSNDGKESPYVVKINSPKIEGVVVVAQGAGTGRKDTEIIEAVQALFEVESHKIKVMRME